MADKVVIIGAWRGQDWRLRNFYREARPEGLPASSRRFESLLQDISDRYHVVASDYAGFAHRDWPHLEHIRGYVRSRPRVVNQFTKKLGVLALHALQAGYGSFRMAYSHRNEAPAVEGALAGLGGANWKTQRDSVPIARQGTRAFDKSPVPAKQRGHAMFRNNLKVDRS
jgi:hypothetical protein